jgi:hypothetical protein
METMVAGKPPPNLDEAEEKALWASGLQMWGDKMNTQTWKCEPAITGSWLIKDMDGRIIASVYGKMDARLIAEAPAMLAELKRLVTVACDLTGGDDTSDLFPSAREIIDRAEGGQ